MDDMMLRHRFGAEFCLHTQPADQESSYCEWLIDMWQKEQIRSYWTSFSNYFETRKLLDTWKELFKRQHN